MKYRKIILIATFVFLSGCGGSKMIGRLYLDNADEVTISTKIGFSSYPSRWVYFEPIGGGMSVYKQDVYESRVTVTVTNNGKSPVSLQLYGKEIRIKSGKSETLEELPFKKIRVLVGSEGDVEANLDFKLKFDQAYTTSSWKLLAAWSDGP